MTVYTTILMDPPWNERGGGKIKRGADRHYPLLRTQEMPGVIYSSGVFTPAANSHLYMWATNNFLSDAMWLMKCLGFAYKTNVCWVKDKKGLGQYFRGQHELLLFGVRGRGPLARTDRKNLSTVIQAERNKHSKKPIEAYHHIEARSHGPYLEMFARERRNGWDAWGKVRPADD